MLESFEAQHPPQQLKTLNPTYDTNDMSYLQNVASLDSGGWNKTNIDGQPLNSNTNYLTNCREMALLGVKGSKPTFNSKYDNAIYHFPIQNGKDRFHKTQKSIPLFEELIKKHSNEGDIVLDTFLGGGTTAIACKNTNRNFKGCEISKEYYDKIMKLI